LIKYDEFVTTTMNSILLEQTEPSTFRLSSAYRNLIKSLSSRLVSVQLKQAESLSSSAAAETAETPVSATETPLKLH